MSEMINILDRKILQELQDSYAATLPVYVYCYAKPYEPLTVFSGSEEEAAFLSAHISEETKKLLVASFADGDVENVIAMDTDVPYIGLRGVAIRDASGKMLGAWIFAGVCMELVDENTTIPDAITYTTTGEFDHVIALIEKTSGMYFDAHGKSISADVKLSEVSSTELLLEEEKRRSEALSDVMKSLESENDFGIVASDVLKIAGEYLHLSDALLLRIDPGETEVDVLSDWSADENDSVTRYFLSMDRVEVPFLTDREYTVSSDSIMPESFRDFFRKYDITAGIFLPLLAEESVPMYLCFIIRHNARKWKVNELRFLSDVKRVVQTVLKLRLRENSLAGTYATIDAVLERGGNGVVVCVPGDPEYIYANERFGRMLADPKDRQNFNEAIAGEDQTDLLINGFYADATKLWYEVHMAPIRWMDGREVIMITLYDITEQKRYEQKIEEQAKTDFLTGLYNRQQFEKDVDLAIKDALRGSNEGSFFIINLDDFKDINGELGHRFGDALLKETARALESVCKAKATCYRLGGDEFAVLVPFFEQPELKRLVSTIQNRFQQPWNLHDTDYFCTMSMGVVCFPKDGSELVSLMQHADVALDVAKKRGPGEVEWYSEKDDEENLKRIAMEKAMRRSVEDGCGEFEVYYQPLMDASKEDTPCLGAEALVRWKSKELGFVKPDDFIGMAEYLGLIVPIGTHILKEACTRCRYWNDFGHPEYRIHVNMSVVQLIQADVVDVVKRTVEETGINPRNLTIEITESVAIRDMAKIKKTLEEIRKMGIRFAMDDFGTGYSSLNRLKELPLDEIKIDKSFVDDLVDDEFSEAFVETVTSLADTIDVGVVVEGVEKKAQADSLGKMKVDFYQGYLYDKPLSAEDFDKKYV